MPRSPSTPEPPPGPRTGAAIGFNTVLLILAALVAWGLFGPYSF
ncbi:hypothetical protein EES41_00775 [Streptomyces sp. ADI95-16]|nr:hypothetical protein EES41_00775 [Streptomyces sp. ADI95-16]